jgi:hypothetical protein
MVASKQINEAINLGVSPLELRGEFVLRLPQH